MKLSQDPVCVHATFIDSLEHRFYKYGRDALWAGLETLDLGVSDEILVPASLCEVVLMAFVKRGMNIQYYGLDTTLAFNPSEIESRVGGATRAVYVNHYLGRPTPLAEIRRICDDKGLFLIEDCAHAFGGRIGEVSLGSFGDISIFSYRKFLPIPDGGGLLVNESSLSMPESLPKSPFIKTFRGVLKLWTLCLARHGFIPLASWKSARGHIDDYLRVEDSIDLAEWEPPLGISDFSRRLVSKADLSTIAEKRRENYRFWMERLGKFDGAKPLFPNLATGQVPFSFPLLVENRNAIVRAVARRGAYLEPSLSAPFRNIDTLVNGDEPFPEIEAISAQMLSLPVHQSLTLANLDWMWSVVKEALEATRRSQQRRQNNLGQCNLEHM
tara:strand:+ start:3213 stop:4364 length:1152 start_codon:yes stop_codon:yes gene_type:complete